MSKDKSLFEIILKAKEGDKDAMQEIILRFQPLIKKNMRNIDMDIKDDISQDIVEVIIKAIKKFDIKWSIICKDDKNNFYDVEYFKKNLAFIYVEGEIQKMEMRKNEA